MTKVSIIMQIIDTKGVMDGLNFAILMGVCALAYQFIYLFINMFQNNFCYNEC
jgi:hypothetical protein